MGIWNECDDQGSFEWSPLKLKMRILPADNADAVELLTELKEAGCLTEYEIDGRKLGAVRNFAVYQRPKKPNSVYPQTDEVRNYVGIKADEVPNQFPTSGENSPQMEDGGCSSSSEPKGSGAAQPDSDTRFWTDAKAYVGKPALVGKWVRDHGKPETARAITAAQIERAVDPIPYIEGYFRKHGARDAQPVVPL
jgi:hypothetical protein